MIIAGQGEKKEKHEIYMGMLGSNVFLSLLWSHKVKTYLKNPFP